MRWNVRLKNTTSWHHWFAWHPVRTSPSVFVTNGTMHRWVWWEWVERKIVPGYADDTTTYRLLVEQPPGVFKRFWKDERSGYDTRRQDQGKSQEGPEHTTPHVPVHAGAERDGNTGT